MSDLFGNKDNKSIKYTLFHDESECTKSNYLYHGYLFVKNNSGREILNQLVKFKEDYNKKNREIHFNELNQHSKSPNGTKTKIALNWLNYSKSFLVRDYLKFYCFGINKNNLKDFWNNASSFDKNVYLRFFEIGLKSAIKFFNLNKISNTFLDNGKYDDERKKRAIWLNNEFFNSNLIHEIETKNIKAISSDEIESNTEYSNFIQLTDLLLGTVRSSFVELGNNQKGQKECVDYFIDIILRFNNKKKAFNKNGRYWKKFSLSFYPTKNNLTKCEFLSYQIKDILKKGNFYLDRKTYIELLEEKINNKLFEI